MLLPGCRQQNAASLLGVAIFLLVLLTIVEPLNARSPTQRRNFGTPRADKPKISVGIVLFKSTFKKREYVKSITEAVTSLNKRLNVFNHSTLKPEAEMLEPNPSPRGKLCSCLCVSVRNRVSVFML